MELKVLKARKKYFFKTLRKEDQQAWEVEGKVQARGTFMPPRGTAGHQLDGGRRPSAVSEMGVGDVGLLRPSSPSRAEPML